jgi:hypothetical protein
MAYPRCQPRGVAKQRYSLIVQSQCRVASGLDEIPPIHGLHAERGVAVVRRDMGEYGPDLRQVFD